MTSASVVDVVDSGLHCSSRTASWSGNVVAEAAGMVSVQETADSHDRKSDGKSDGKSESVSPSEPAGVTPAVDTMVSYPSCLLTLHKDCLELCSLLMCQEDRL
jgi:hypothetical protein